MLFCSSANELKIKVKKAKKRKEYYYEKAYDNACDFECNICGDERENTPHKYLTCLDAKCYECGYTREAIGHIYDNACDVDCNSCGEQRDIQHRYNEEHGITPVTIKKAVRDLIRISKKAEVLTEQLDKDLESMSKKELQALEKQLQKKMTTAASSCAA